MPPNHKFLQKLVRLISNKVPEVVPENAKMDLYWVRTSEEPAVFIVVELGSFSLQVNPPVEVVGLLVPLLSSLLQDVKNNMIIAKAAMVFKIVFMINKI